MRDSFDIEGRVANLTGKQGEIILSGAKRRGYRTETQINRQDFAEQAVIFTARYLKGGGAVASALIPVGLAEGQNLKDEQPVRVQIEMRDDIAVVTNFLSSVRFG